MSINSYIAREGNFLYNSSYTLINKFSTNEYTKVRFLNNDKDEYRNLIIYGEKVYFDYGDYLDLFFDFGITIGEKVTSGKFNNYHLEKIVDVTLLNGEIRKGYVIKKDMQETTLVKGIGDIRRGIFFGDYEEFSEYRTTLVCVVSKNQVLIENQNLLKTCDELKCIHPRPNFTLTEENKEIKFNNTSIYSSHFVWDFGDGNTSMEVNPTHEYEKAACYKVTLRSGNNCTSKVNQISKKASACSKNRWVTKDTRKENMFLSCVVGNNVYLISNDSILIYSIKGVFLKARPIKLSNVLNNSITNLKMWDDDHGILTRYADNDSTGVYITNDGGNTWQPRILEYPTNSNYIELGSNGLVYIPSYDIYFYRSTDFGNSWTKIPTKPKELYNEFLYANDYFVLARGYFVDSFIYKKQFYKSTDFGLTWQTYDVTNNIDRVVMLNANVGFGISSNNITFYTEDGCATWDSVNTPYLVSNLYPSDSTHIWFRDESQFLYYSEDKLKTATLTTCDPKQLYNLIPINDSLAVSTESFYTTIIPSYIFDSINLYFYDKSKEDGCVVNTSEQVYHSNEFQVYPNPSGGLISLNVPQNYVGSLKIFCVDGKLIKEVDKISKDYNFIDLTEHKGILFLKFISNSGEEVISKLVILP